MANWTVDYYVSNPGHSWPLLIDTKINGVSVPVTGSTHFYSDGAWLFLNTSAEYDTVYLHDTHWRYQGHLGETTLPAGLPPINLTGFYEIVAVPSLVSAPLIVPTMTPEPSTAILLISALLFTLVGQKILRRKHNV